MAVRLPVILAQSSSRSTKQSAAEEEWITHLLFESRLDATLVSDLPNIAEDSTDQLCLEGIKGDFLLLSWLEPSVCLQNLERLLQIPLTLLPIEPLSQGGKRLKPLHGSAHGIDRVGNTVGKPKKVYYLHLGEHGDFSHSKVAVSHLLQSLSTPVFQLGSTLKKRIAPAIGPSTSANSDEQPTGPRPAAVLPQSSPKVANSSPDIRDLSASDLSATDLSAVDSLVDELNGLDL